MWTERQSGSRLHSDVVLHLCCATSFSYVPLNISTRNTVSHDPAVDNDAVELRPSVSNAELSQPPQSSSSHDEHDGLTALSKNGKTSM